MCIEQKSIQFNEKKIEFFFIFSIFDLFSYGLFGFGLDPWL